MLKSRYCFNTYHGKVGRRVTLIDEIKRYFHMKHRKTPDVFMVTWY